jgi:hypothetical protein
VPDFPAFESEDRVPFPSEPYYLYLMVPLQSTHHDPDVERPLLPRRVDKFMRTWDWAKVGEITVAYDHDMGRLIRIDGGHRIEAAMGIGIEALPMKVWYGLTKPQMQAMFVGLNDQATVQAIERFVKSVGAGDEESVMVYGIIRNHGLEVRASSGDGVFHAAASAVTAYRLDGTGEALDKALTTILTAWGRTEDAVQAPLVAGFTRWHRRHHDLSCRELASKVKVESARAFLAEAKAIRSTRAMPLWRAVAQHATDRYNHRRQDSNRLPSW